MTTSTPVLARPVVQLVAFCLGAAACVVAGISGSALMVGIIGSSGNGMAFLIAGALIASGLLILSVWLLKREGASVSGLGLTGRRRAGEFGFGFAIGLPLFIGLAVVQSLSVSAPWIFQGTTGMAAALAGLVPVAVLVLVEELLFRGVGLRALRRLYGDWPAIVLSALLFGCYHLIGSDDWAIGAFFRFATSMAGGLVFAWMAVRSGGLALPFGLHLGGNWVQTSIAILSPTGDGLPATSVWRIPITTADVAQLSAPDLLPRLPYFAAIVIAVALVLRFLGARADATYRAG